MAWCHQATSNYLSQCWLRSLLPYGIIRPQWVNHPRNHFLAQRNLQRAVMKCIYMITGKFIRVSDHNLLRKTNWDMYVMALCNCFAWYHLINQNILDISINQRDVQKKSGLSLAPCQVICRCSDVKVLITYICRTSIWGHWYCLFVVFLSQF